MPFLMSDYYAAEHDQQANEIQRQIIAQNEINASEAKRVLAENAKADEIKTKAYNAPQAYKTFEIPDATSAAVAPQGMIPTQASTGLVPQKGLTGLGGMSTPQQAPVGMQPTDNLGGMQTAQPVAPTGMQQESTPTFAAPPESPIAKATTSAKEYKIAESELQKAQGVANELHKAGLHDQADAYMTKQTSLIKNVEAAKDEHLKNTAALAEHAAGLGNGFLEAVQSGANPNEAWAQFLIKASAEGYPIESLLPIVDPKERIAKATQIVNDAETTKQRAQMEREVYKETGRNQRASDAAILRTTLSSMATTRAAANQAAIQDRWQAGQNFQKYKASLANFETNVKNAQNQRDDYDTQITVVDKKIADIDNLVNLSIPKEERPAAIEALRQQREILTTARTAADKDVRDQTAALQELQQAGKLIDKEESIKATTRPKLDTTKYNYTKKIDPATKESYKKVMEHAKSLLKTNPQEAERIQAEAQKRMLNEGYLIKAS